MLLSTKSFLNKKPSNGVGKYLTISCSCMTIFLAPLCVNILTELPQFFFFGLSPVEPQNILLSWYGGQIF